MKTVMIMGGTKGVGFEILKSCLEKGYNVSFCGRNADEGNKIIKTLNAEDKLYFCTLDLNTTYGIENFVKQTLNKFKTIDALVLYSGITPVATLTGTEEEVFDSVFNINLKAPYFFVKHVLKSMIENGKGSIVFFGSPHMDYGDKDRAAYAITKGSLYTLSNHIAHHYAKYGIRSNYVVMGWTKTEGEIALRNSEQTTEDELDKMAAKTIPMGSILEPYDQVPAVMYFISDESAMTTGSLLRITGGHYI